MNRKLASIFWGIVLIGGGVYALAQSMGYITYQNPTLWIFIFGGISIVSLIFYIIDGLRNWGWLFPVCIFGALAFMLAMLQRGGEDPSIASPLFIGIGLPFLVAFVIDRAKNWWALIPMGVMAFLTLVLLMVDRVPGEWIGSAFLFILAISFFLVYLSRRMIWAAIVAYVLFILGFMPIMALTNAPELAGVIFFLAIGLPFLFIYLRSPDRWWAMIPAGILLTLGGVTLLAIIPEITSQSFNITITSFILFAGFSLTFGVLWLKHHMSWAMIASIVLAVAAIASLFIKRMEFIAPIFIILAGVYLLLRSLRPKKV